MSKTVKEWKNNIRLISTGKLKYFHNALNTLNKWDLFMEEFDSVNDLSVLPILIKDELDKRSKNGK